MLSFYINRAGKSLPERTLKAAKHSLRRLFRAQTAWENPLVKKSVPALSELRKDPCSHRPPLLRSS